MGRIGCSVEPLTFASTGCALIHQTYSHARSPSMHLRASSLRDQLSNRVHGAIIISLGEEPFHLSDMDAAGPLYAAAVSAGTKCHTRTPDHPVIAVCFDPNYDHFRSFCALPAPGVLQLARTLFIAMDVELRAALYGELPLDAAAALIDRIAALVIPLLPVAVPQDERVRMVCDLVRRDPNVSLSEIASAMSLSYGRASHLFVQAVGMPFRDYRLWYKLRRFAWLMWSGESHTAAAHGAGFSDSAHVCRTFQKLHGRPPSYFFDGRFTNIHVRTAPDSAPRSAWRGIETGVVKQNDIR